MFHNWSKGVFNHICTTLSTHIVISETCLPPPRCFSDGSGYGCLGTNYNSKDASVVENLRSKVGQQGLDGQKEGE